MDAIGTSIELQAAADLIHEDEDEDDVLINDSDSNNGDDKGNARHGLDEDEPDDDLERGKRRTRAEEKVKPLTLAAAPSLVFLLLPRLPLHRLEPLRRSRGKLTLKTHTHARTQVGLVGTHEQYAPTDVRWVMLTAQGVANLKSYKYSGVDLSLYYAKFASPLAGYLTERFTPRWVAPNVS